MYLTSKDSSSNISMYSNALVICVYTYVMYTPTQ